MFEKQQTLQQKPGDDSNPSAGAPKIPAVPGAPDEPKSPIAKDAPKANVGGPEYLMKHPKMFEAWLEKQINEKVEERLLSSPRAPSPTDSVNNTTSGLDPNSKTVSEIPGQTNDLEDELPNSEQPPTALTTSAPPQEEPPKVTSPGVVQQLQGEEPTQSDSRIIPSNNEPNPAPDAKPENGPGDVGVFLPEEDEFGNNPDLAPANPEPEDPPAVSEPTQVQTDIDDQTTSNGIANDAPDNGQGIGPIRDTIVTEPQGKGDIDLIDSNDNDVVVQQKPEEFPGGLPPVGKGGNDNGSRGLTPKIQPEQPSLIPDNPNQQDPAKNAKRANNPKGKKKPTPGVESKKKLKNSDEFNPNHDKSDGKFTTGGGSSQKSEQPSVKSPADHWDSLDIGGKFDLLGKIMSSDISGIYLNKTYDELPDRIKDKFNAQAQADQVLTTDKFVAKDNFSDSLKAKDIETEVNQIHEEFELLEKIASDTIDHPTTKLKTKIDYSGFKRRDFLHSTFSSYNIAPFSENDVEALWEELGEINPEVKKGFETMKKRVADMNAKSQKAFETSESFYRGTSVEELDTYLKTGTTNVFDDKYKLNYEFTAVAPHREMADIYNNGVTVEYDGDDVRRDGEPVNYDLFWRDTGTRTETKENGKMDAIYMDQMEVRLDRNTPLKDLKIKNIYLTKDNAHLADKYAKLGNVIIGGERGRG